MSSRPRHFGFIAASGASGVDAPWPSPYSMLAGTPLLARTIAALAEWSVLETIYVVIAADDAAYRERVGEMAGVVVLPCGGRTRADSVRNGLAAIAGEVDAQDWVLVHDAARPCIDVATLSQLVDELEDDPVGGLLAIPLADTLKRSEPGGGHHCAGTEARAGLWCAQTPEMFRYAILRRAFGQTDVEAFTDEAEAIEALGLEPRLVQGSAANIKVTCREDLDLAAAIIDSRRRER